jgi:RNA polymerase sigma-70 factor (ECF subfamily)
MAKDAVSETMTRAVANIARLRFDGAGFDAWMYGIARYVVIDAQRKMRREAPGIVPDTADPRPLPSDQALQGEDTDEVRAAFAQLNSTDQEVLELRVVANLSVEEVSSVLGRRPGAVRMAQSRALDRLRTIMLRKERERCRV